VSQQGHLSDLLLPSRRSSKTKFHGWKGGFIYIPRYRSAFHHKQMPQKESSQNTTVLLLTCCGHDCLFDGCIAFGKSKGFITSG
jgi:hypothetical protein